MQRGFFLEQFFPEQFFSRAVFFRKKKRREAVCGSCAEIRIAAAVLLQQKKRQPYNLFFWVYFYRKVFLFRSDSEDNFRVRSS